MFLGVKHAQKGVRRDKKVYVLSDRGHRYNFVELRRQKNEISRTPTLSRCSGRLESIGNTQGQNVSVLLSERSGLEEVLWNASPSDTEESYTGFN